MASFNLAHNVHDMTFMERHSIELSLFVSEKIDIVLNRLMAHIA